MVNNIKTFDERIKELVTLGKEQGYLTYEQIAKKIVLLLEKLDEHDDVQNVYSNFEASDEIMAMLDM